MKKQEKCRCKELMPGHEIIFVHLYGCPEDYSIREYDTLPWYKKLLQTNPRKRYWEHFK